MVEGGEEFQTEGFSFDNSELNMRFCLIFFSAYYKELIWLIIHLKWEKK